jgi:hypothetical protein
LDIYNQEELISNKAYLSHQLASINKIKTYNIYLWNI